VNVEQRQATADPQTKPPDLGCGCRLFQAAIVYNHRRHLLLSLSPKADTPLPSHGGWKAELKAIIQMLEERPDSALQC